jgi:PAS domain S-box-containing protein
MSVGSSHDPFGSPNTAAAIRAEDPNFAKRVEGILASLGIVVHGEASAEKPRDPAIVVIEGAAERVRHLSTACRSQWPAAPQLLVVPDGNLESLAESLEAMTPEILRNSAGSAELRLALRRVLATAAAVGPEPVSSTGAETATDRVTVVLQILTLMGMIINRLAKEVQGGVRYLNELTYCVSIHDRDCRVVGTNDTYRQYFGDRRKKPSWEIFTGQRASRSSCPVGQAVDKADIVSLEASVRYNSGIRVPVIVHAAPILDDDGRVDLVLEVFASVKEVDRLAGEIRNTQRRYRRLFNAVPNYIAVLDRKMRLTAFNRRFMEDFGFKTGRLFYDLFKPLTPPEGESPMEKTLRDGQPHHGELLLVAPTGEQLSLVAWTSPLKTAAGKLIEVLTIFTDVTELRRLQDNLSQLGLMISTISHTLKSSLTGLDAGLYLIDKGFYRERPGRIEEGLDVARLMTERIRKLIRDILHYSKDREIQPENTDTARFSSDLAASLEMQIRGADIRFVHDIDPNAGWAEIDSGLMRTALTNILDNAVEACLEDESKQEHVIHFSVRSDAGDIRFTVSDNGPGMEREHRQNIFKLFWSSKGIRGTGLGLFIARNVIQKHGGSIEAASEPGQGTTFTIRIPQKSIDRPRS